MGAVGRGVVLVGVQNVNLSASWRIRGSSALVIWPNVGVPKVRPRPEAPAAKLGNEMPGRMLLVTLKAWAVNSSIWPSRMRNSLETAESKLKNDGPGIFMRPVALSVPSAGVAKAAGLIQQLGAGPGLGHNGFCNTWTGRWLPAASWVSETSLARTAVTQVLEVARKISANFQPEAIMLNRLFENLGISYTTVVLKMCRRSEENVP